MRGSAILLDRRLKATMGYHLLPVRVVVMITQKLTGVYRVSQGRTLLRMLMRIENVQAL